MNILVSACLLGVNCKYNGNNNKVEKLLEHMQNVTLIPICPEQLGGLTTPRPPAEYVEEAKILNNIGIDVTKEFAIGAEETLRIAKLCNCSFAILKERSPSCGSKQIYDGSFQGKVKDGMGVTARLLEQNGIKVYSEENFEEIL
ncbi:MAG: purine-nucleoside phosphorylase [Clostridiales bacterium GWB2_37_7]|nr:MAG: purine-nucleoside phosphorylase [Clostridiales bacterium GWB2_37_7]